MYPYLTIGVAHGSLDLSKPDSNRTHEESLDTNTTLFQSKDQDIEQQKCHVTDDKACAVPERQKLLKADIRLVEVATKNHINSQLVKRLQLLKNFNIIVVCADSTSMKTRLDDMKYSRWDELRLIVEIVIEVGSVFNPSGIDVYFLNRPSLLNVSDLGLLDQAFVSEPHGCKSLTSVLKSIFKAYNDETNNDKKMLVLVAIGGEPIDDEGNSNVATLQHVMQHERQSDKIHVVFLACTDNESSVAYLEEWDDIMQNISITDDYRTERDYQHRRHGSHYPFSFGDYVATALLNAIDSKVDVSKEIDTGNDTSLNIRRVDTS
ncbi:unnamed protein product [Rotaria socialis]|uniref:VWFA domain-containing protein n=2 Tax=Rotaria socialis TaxID=392032 RepID=A0A818EVW6_9BILA|nr:unnamed protein product [Rotaria socialis]CAF3465452.1 unnamed protein product [Rotaria socialis]CAF3598911.1 unnamed protein product [Rotaria socialis]